jgi:NADH:ubiquinone oxidoreductase subunit 3 (subunit A)
MSDMHDGYSLSQYISVGLYMIGMILLFVGIFILSMWLNNKLFKKNKNKIYSIKNKSNKQKQWFYDVA